MPLDTSIPLQAKAPEFNPLQQALQVAQFRYMNANGLAQQQAINANRATSAAYQQATDPNTGAVDNNKLVGILSQNPDAAYNLPQVIQGINTQKKQQIDIDSSQLDNLKSHINWAYQTASAVASNPNATTDDVMGALSQAIKGGQITPQIASQAIADMPPPNAPQGSLQSWAARHAAQAAGAAQQLQMQMPTYAQTNTGPATVAVNTNPYAANGGVGTVGYTVQNGLSQSEALSPGVTINQGGQPVTYTKGQMAAGQVPQQQSGGYQTAPPMGAQGVADKAGERYSSLQQAASQAKPLMQTYDLAAQALQSTIAGKGANAALNVPALLNTFGIQAGSDSLKNNQLLVNYLNSAADQAASSLGLSGSDSRLAAAKAGQPDASNMNAPALLESIQHVKGLQQAVLDRQQATTNFLAQNGNNTSALPQFETKWNQSFNPDVSYVRSLGDPAAQQAAMQKLKAEGKLQQWTKDYQAMKALGAF
jgi:hypothetical protein